MPASARHLVPDRPLVPPTLAPATPYLSLDLPTVAESYRRLAAALPVTAVHYAVKANPEPAVLAALRAEGSRFDVASPADSTHTLGPQTGDDFGAPIR